MLENKTLLSYNALPLKYRIERPNMSTIPLNTTLPSQKDNRLSWGNLKGFCKSLAISDLAQKSKNVTLVITNTIHDANILRDELKFFCPADLPISLFPDWETLPYDHFSPHQDIISERLLTLYRLAEMRQGIVIAAIPTLMHCILPKEYLFSSSFILSTNDKFDIEKTRNKLVHAGYRAVGQVMEHGEFTIRGSIIDIFPMGSNTPFRIELFDEDVESIRSFDPDSQRSLEKLKRIELLPAGEYPLTDDAITRFRQSWRAAFAGNPKEAPIYQQISEGESAAGAEYYLPFFYENTASFFDYLNEKTNVVLIGNVMESAQGFAKEIHERYEQLRYDVTRPLCPKEDIFLSPDQVFQKLKPFTQIKISTEKVPEKPGQINFASEVLPNISVDHKAKEPLKKLSSFIKMFSENKNAKILFCAESSGRRETLLELLKDNSIEAKTVENWQSFLAEKETISITTGGLTHGAAIISPPISIITESQLFGEKVKQRQHAKQRQLDPNLIIRNLTELSIGSPVVHINHGVGRYQGLETIKSGEQEAEFLTLAYADNAKIYVPVSSLHLISRYTGADAASAPLSKLGSKQWDRNKKKTLEQIRDVAAELLDVYARRHASKGFAFKDPDADYKKFRAAFPFEETPDQKNAIDNVLKDMVKPQAMDRLVCGDVGFGKTEVAMQAAFLATQSNKQVAILVPTTLLATQHAQNFQDRFADWPIKVACLSRLRSTKEQNETIQSLANGYVDIVVGTHKLLSEKIKFKNLGLLIVDEEQRFGVKQKERIKSLRANVDILTLTATPIPRTLNMALSGTRDLSIITTPPARRLSVKTFVQQENKGLIREAILRETMRGGQIYFLHNEVSTIDATAEKLQDIVPEARIGIGHGQMREGELERVMSDFYHQRFNVLVCSTIVESGIDVPSANTIIINRADRFGLAQLHQLRGRVGRSHHQAYAYLITPPRKAMTSDARKRLDAIAELADIGSGFSLSTHDLEIRGAGELLGEEQSGQIQAVGFTLYMELLEEAVTALKEGREPALEKPLNSGPEIDLGISALLPKEYIADIHIRLTLYKRLANCENKEAMQELKSEMIDRFGLLPDQAQSLFQITELKILAKKLGINKIEMGKKFGYIVFNEKPDVDPAKIIKLIQLQPKVYQLQGSDKLRFVPNIDENCKRVGFVGDLLKKLSA